MVKTLDIKSKSKVSPKPKEEDTESSSMSKVSPNPKGKVEGGDEVGVEELLRSDLAASSLESSWELLSLGIGITFAEALQNVSTIYG